MIQDQGCKKGGSGINISDVQHWLDYMISDTYIYYFHVDSSRFVLLFDSPVLNFTSDNTNLISKSTNKMWFTTGNLLCFLKWHMIFVFLTLVSLFRTDPVFQCNICKKTCENSRKLRRHRETHTRIRSKCLLCGKLVANLSSHTSQSHGLKKFICSICGSSFVSKSHLAVHVNIVHLKKKKKCNFCDKLCTNLTSHKLFCKKTC